tara:strand:+ start:123 stop:446 length:324 start_codon:yes stop_codon:yes gene_type:complete
MDLYSLEKTRLSELQSNFHKLLNTLKRNNITEIDLESSSHLEIMEINNSIDSLNSRLIYITESIETKNIVDNNSKENIKRINEIDNDNKAISQILPILLKYRMMLDP